MTSGIYQLWLRLPRAARIKVGKLGTCLFPVGFYVYTGSALNGLEQRLARHQRRRKKLHWHIDYLLRHAEIAEIIRRRTRRGLECAWNRQMLRLRGAKVIAPNFGSSDCDCPSHLVYLGQEAPWTFLK